MKKLGYCPNCKEKSAVTKTYDIGRELRRIEYCINKGCGYRQYLSPLMEGGSDAEHLCGMRDGRGKKDEVTQQ